MDFVGGSEATVSRTIQKLVSLLVEESRFSRGIEISEVESLRSELEIIRIFIMDVSARSVEEELSHEVKIWLKQAKEVAEMVEDFVDKYILKASRLPGPRRSSVGQLNYTLSSRCKLSSNIQSIKALLRQMHKRGQRQGISNHLSRRGASATVSDRVYDLVLNENIFYNYTEKRKRFVDHAWITVSASYDLEAVLIDMVRQFGAAGNRDVRREELIDTLKQDLQSKSRIIITTRRESVAVICEESSFDHVHWMEPLTETMSRDLFCLRAFQHGHEGPVAGVLSTKEKTRSEWQRIYDNFEFEIESNPHLEDISRLLVLSFRDLPYQLKMCFLYFSIFPDDYLIPNEKLVKLWIAEDFVQAKGLKTSEEVAEEYLNELIQRNLIQACEGFYGLEKFCRINDNKNSSFRGKSHRLSISGKIEENFLGTLKNSQVRTVFLSNISAQKNSFVVTLFRKHKLLTLLDFENVPLDRLLEEVGNLFHLKYLSLKNTKVKRLPKSVGKLHNLKTLDVRNTLLAELPIEINELLNLQHLLANRSDSTISLN
ncbi:hypothetical protein TIFTF001_041086 [Ficus carica]|uniref:Uncharacterized protein n=1 Tax=Ficus carica TaxID=3494 RepID=A0AA88CRZ0_FICCA|nr:hypothetical protein TIFTF001_041086 [Ficus carica]